MVPWVRVCFSCGHTATRTAAANISSEQLQRTAAADQNFVLCTPSDGATKTQVLTTKIDEISEWRGAFAQYVKALRQDKLVKAAVDEEKDSLVRHLKTLPREDKKCHSDLRFRSRPERRRLGGDIQLRCSGRLPLIPARRGPAGDSTTRDARKLDNNCSDRSAADSVRAQQLGGCSAEGFLKNSRHLQPPMLLSFQYRAPALTP